MIQPSSSYFLTRKLVLFDDWSDLAVHVAMDNTVVIEDISKRTFMVLS